MEVPPLTQPKITVVITFKSPSSLRRAVYDVDAAQTWEGPCQTPLLLLKVRFRLYYTVVASFKLDDVAKFTVRDYTKREIQ